MRLSKRRQDVNNQEELGDSIVATTFEAALDAFLSAQDAAGHSKVSKDDYRRVVSLFLRYMSDTHQYACVQDITERDMLEWMAYLRNTDNKLGRPYSSRSIRTYCVDVFAFFNWLFKHRYLETNPVELLDAPKVERPLIRVFTEEELQRLDAACDRAPHGKSLTPDERKALAARDRAMLWLLLSTGIRLSELCGLRFRDIDWKQGMVYVFGKGAKERKVPFGGVARQHLNTYLVYWRGEPNDAENEYVFLGAFGHPITRFAVKKMFERLNKSAGISDKRVSAHTCRHWFAVNAIKRGMPTAALRDMLGHESWSMMEVYVQLAEQDVKDIYMKFSPVDSLTMHQSSKGKREQLRGWRNARSHQKKG